MPHKDLFFSIVIPAHNEENYLGDTLRAIQALRYPETLFEVIIVENNSRDNTRAIAESFQEEHIYVHSLDEKGVSRAKNFALTQVSTQSDWIIFLDADTRLLPNFLSDLNAYLLGQEEKNFVVGTTSVLPLENKSLYARAWFRFYDWGHKWTKTSFAIQIAKTQYARELRFDEYRHFGEDLEFIKKMLAFGNFCFFKTNTVLTSTRRFEKVGWFKLFFLWNYQAQVLARLESRKHGAYDVVR